MYHSICKLSAMQLYFVARISALTSFFFDNSISEFKHQVQFTYLTYQVEKDTCDYVNKVFAELNSPNKCKVYMEHGGNWWVTDFNDPQYIAGRKATQLG